MSNEINVIVNGLKETAPKEATISYLLDHFDEKDPHLIVEHNGRFVYPGKYSTTKVSEGDILEFIGPNFGG